MLAALQYGQRLQAFPCRFLKRFGSEIRMHERNVMRQTRDGFAIEQIGERTALLDRTWRSRKSGVSNSRHSDIRTDFPEICQASGCPDGLFRKMASFGFVPNLGFYAVPTCLRFQHSTDVEI